MKRYKNRDDMRHGEYVYNGSGIIPKPEETDNGKAEQLARKVNRRKKVNSDDLERWK